MLHRIRHDCVKGLALLALNDNDRDNAIYQVNYHLRLLWIAVATDL
jgi:hypothetical protein